MKMIFTRKMLVATLLVALPLGNIALAVEGPPEFVFKDRCVPHQLTDAFLLAKTPEGWRVSAVSYTVLQPPTCERHPQGPP